MQELKTTLGKIKSFDPCVDGWKKLIKTVGNSDEKTEVTLLQILDSNGPEDAYWALRCWNYKEYAPLLANVAESVVYIYSEQFPDDNRVQKCIDTIRAYANGDCSRGLLRGMLRGLLRGLLRGMLRGLLRGLLRGMLRGLLRGLRGLLRGLLRNGNAANK
jgi:hypothetical protein